MKGRRSRRENPSMTRQRQGYCWMPTKCMRTKLLEPCEAHPSAIGSGPLTVALLWSVC
jgi:hypothetical protein